MTMSGEESRAGFSTIEMLAAFVILSLGLGLAVQSVSQARMSLKRANDSAAETVIYRRVMSEELPRLLMAYRGKPLLASGPSWQAGIRPLSSTDIQGPVEVIVEVMQRANARPAATYVSIVPAPPGTIQNTEIEQLPAGDPE